MKYRKKVAVVSAIVALVLTLCGGVLLPKNTSATWIHQRSTQASFKAAAPPEAITSYSCTDNGILIGLAANRLQLDWKAPLGVDSSSLEYVVTYKESGLLNPRSETVTTPLTTYTYIAEGSLLSLLNLSVQITITPKYKGSTWVGKTTTQQGLAISVGLSAAVRCGTVSTSP